QAAYISGASLAIDHRILGLAAHHTRTRSLDGKARAELLGQTCNRIGDRGRIGRRKIIIHRSRRTMVGMSRKLRQTACARVLSLPRSTMPVKRMERIPMVNGPSTSLLSRSPM